MDENLNHRRSFSFGRGLLSAFLAFGLFLLVLWLAGPKLARLALERAVSFSLRGNCTVGEFSFAVAPFRLFLRDLQVKMDDGSTLLIKGLNATGRVSKGTLVLEALNLGRVSLSLKGVPSLPPPSALGGTALALTKAFLFKRVRILKGEFEGGEVTTSELKLTLGRFQVIGQNSTLVIGSVSADLTQPEVSLQFPLSLSFPSSIPLDGDVAVGFEVDGMRAKSSSIKGEVKAKGELRFREWALHNAEASVWVERLRMGKRVFPSVTLFARAAFVKERAFVEPFAFSFPTGNLTGKTVVEFKPRLRVEAALRPSLGGVRLDGIKVNATALDDGFAFTFLGEKTGLFSLMVPLTGVSCEGIDRFSVVGKVTQREVGFNATLEGKGLRFQSRDGEKAGEGIEGEIKVKGRLLPSLSRLNLEAVVNIPRGEFLFGNIYLDLSETPLSLACSLDSPIGERRVKLSHCAFGLKSLGTIKGEGKLSFEPFGVDGWLTLEPTKVAPLFSTFLVEPFKDEHPVLAKLEVGGKVGAEADLSLGTKVWGVKGRVNWNGELNLDTKGASFRGVHLNLPVWLSGVKAPERRGLRGELAIKYLTVPLLEQRSLAFSLEAHPNRLLVKGSPLKVLGGKVAFAPIELGWKRGFYAKTNLSLHGLDLSGLLPLPKGEKLLMESRRLQIELERGSLLCRGNITILGFGGRMKVWGIEAKNLLSPAPFLSLNARWKGIDLERLTKGTSFGRITGRLAGEIRGLQIAYGQPQAFELEMESVSGVPQRISVKAVENIAEISGSTSPFVGLAGGVASLFHSFPYSKIGVRATLKNDQFRIWGIAHKGDSYYLVKRGLWGVDVVVQDPGKPIGFNEMLRRIREVMSSKERSVIK